MKRDPKDVFKLLELHKTNGNLINDELFPTWVEMVESRYAKSTEAYNYMFRFLTNYFEEELAFVKALIRGTESERTNDIAWKLLDSQANKWANDKENLTRMFKRLELQKPDDNLFESPYFTLWFKFVTKTIKNKRKRYMEVLKILNTQYQGDNLTSLLVKKGQSNFHNFASALLKIQCDEWVLDKTKSVEYVFDTLQLNKKDSNPLESSLFSVWVHFVEKRFRFQAAQKKMVETLSSYFGSKKALKRALNNGKNARQKRTRRVAVELLEYMGVEKVREEATAVYILLTFHKTEESLFNSPLFSKWVDFVKSRLDDEEAKEMIFSILENVDRNEEIILDAKTAKRPQPKRQKTFDLNTP